MAQEEGHVITVGDDGWAQVVTSRRTECGDCNSSHCCASLGSGSKMVVKALNRAGAGVGDLVFINLSSRTVLKIAAILYIIPVLGLLSGVWVGENIKQGLFSDQSNMTILLGFAGLILGFILIAIISRIMSADERLYPVITRILKTGAETAATSMTVDPVCKMTIDPVKAPVSFQYQDHIYYFCHPRCRDEFTKNPEKYHAPPRLGMRLRNMPRYR